MAQTLEQHSLSRFTLSDIQPKFKYDSREPDTMAEITFYLNYSSYKTNLISLKCISTLQKQATCIAENAEFIESLSEDDPITLEDNVEFERSKDEILDGDFDDEDFYIDYEE